MIPHKIVLSLIVLSLSIIKSESSHLANLNKTTSVGLSKFYYADKLFYLTLEEPKFDNLTIVVGGDSKTITISEYDDICKINTTTFDLQSQDKIFQFQHRKNKHCFPLKSGVLWVKVFQVIKNR